MKSYAGKFLLFCAVAAVSLATTFAVVRIAHADALNEDFDSYSVGLIDGLNGGGGFAGPWTLFAGSGNNVTDTDYVSSPNSMLVEADGSYRDTPLVSGIDTEWQMKLPSGAHPSIAFGDMSGLGTTGCYLEINVGYVFLNNVISSGGNYTPDVWQQWRAYTDGGDCVVTVDGVEANRQPMLDDTFDSMLFTWGGSGVSYFVDDIVNTDPIPPIPPAPTSTPIGGATSTVEQAQTNLFFAFVLFYASMFGIIWLMRKH